MAQSPLDAALSELGLELAPETRQQLLDLVVLVERWATRINLTGHRGPEGVLRGLVLDALALERVLPGCETLLDLGSGAGFPGLPIAVVRSQECRVTLLDSRQRRNHFQRAAIRELRLHNVNTLLGRSEALDPTGHEIVLAQALAQPLRAIDLMRRWVAPGGRIALAVSQPPDPAQLKESGIAESEVRSYRVPVTGRDRVLWIGKLEA